MTVSARQPGGVPQKNCGAPARQTRAHPV